MPMATKLENFVQSDAPPKDDGSDILKNSNVEKTQSANWLEIANIEMDHRDEERLSPLLGGLNGEQSSIAGDSTSNKTLGSQRRQQQLMRRSSCNQHSQLWRRASMRTTPGNRSRSLERRKSSLLKFIKNSVHSQLSLESLAENGGDTFLEDCAKLAEEFEGYAFENEDSNLDESLDLKDLEEDEKAKRIAKEKHLFATRRASQNLYRGEGFEVDQAEILSMYLDAPQHYNPWESQTDVNGIEFDFCIIGTSVDDVHATPHVLSPPLIDSLQDYLPFVKQGQNCWLKYSLVRDGADFNAFLNNTRDNDYTVLAIETVEGEVFGSFTRSSWRREPEYYGSGEAFLWRMKGSRADVLGSVFEQAQREAQIETYPYSFQNKIIQICQSNRIAVGGGTTMHPREISPGVVIPPHKFGFGICFEDGTLLHATSSPCLTFNSPSLSNHHKDGSNFEVLNLEVWTFTPCMTLKEAELMEEKHRFMRSNSDTIAA